MRPLINIALACAVAHGTVASRGGAAHADLPATAAKMRSLQEATAGAPCPEARQVLEGATTHGRIDFTGGYANYTRCEWAVRCAERDRPAALLRFTALNTQHGHDFVSVYDGLANLTLAADLSGDSAPPGAFGARGGELVVVFESDCTVSADGFVAEFWCGSLDTIGCTDPAALGSFDPNAMADDGSCTADSAVESGTRDGTIPKEEAEDGGLAGLAASVFALSVPLIIFCAFKEKMFGDMCGAHPLFSLSPAYADHSCFTGDERAKVCLVDIVNGMWSTVLSAVLMTAMGRGQGYPEPTCGFSLIPDFSTLRAIDELPNLDGEALRETGLAKFSEQVVALVVKTLCEYLSGYHWMVQTYEKDAWGHAKQQAWADKIRLGWYAIGLLFFVLTFGAKQLVYYDDREVNGIPYPVVCTSFADGCSLPGCAEMYAEVSQSLAGSCPPVAGTWDCSKAVNNTNDSCTPSYGASSWLFPVLTVVFLDWFFKQPFLYFAKRTVGIISGERLGTPRPTTPILRVIPKHSNLRDKHVTEGAGSVYAHRTVHLWQLVASYICFPALLCCWKKITAKEGQTWVQLAKTHEFEKGKLRPTVEFAIAVKNPRRENLENLVLRFRISRARKVRTFWLKMRRVVANCCEVWPFLGNV